MPPTQFHLGRGIQLKKKISKPESNWNGMSRVKVAIRLLQDKFLIVGTLEAVP